MYINNNDEIQNNNKKGDNKMDKILSYEEIKQLFKKNKNRADRYHAAYDELMKLDKDTCQADCRYYKLFKHLWSVFDPCRYNTMYADVKDAEMYFNIVKKCVDSYALEEDFYALLKCYSLGIGTPIDDKGIAKTAKDYFNSVYYLREMRDCKTGTIDVEGQTISYEIDYLSNDKISIDWSFEKRHELFMVIDSYRDLSTQELKELGKEYLVEREKRQG